MAKRKFPDTVLVYVGDVVEHEPVLYVTPSLEGIDEDHAGEMVAEYRLVRLRRFTVKRTLT